MLNELENIKYIAVIDLEMCCWENGLDRDKMEIIEIGIVVLDINTLEEISRISRVIKPLNNPILSDYCKNLTHISQEEIDAAQYLKPTLEDLIGSLPPINDFLWCAWGNDPIWLQKELKSQGSDIVFDKRFINLKLKDGKRRGLSKALKSNNIEQVLPAHRALADAISTARLAKKLQISINDVQVSNKKTYGEKLLSSQKEQISKLCKRCNIKEKTATYILKELNWDFNRSKHIINLIKEEV